MSRSASLSSCSVGSMYDVEDYKPGVRELNRRNQNVFSTLLSVRLESLYKFTIPSRLEDEPYAYASLLTRNNQAAVRFTAIAARSEGLRLCDVAQARDGSTCGYTLTLRRPDAPRTRQNTVIGLKCLALPVWVRFVQLAIIDMRLCGFCTALLILGTSGTNIISARQYI